MKTAAEYLKEQADRHHFTCHEAYDTDYDLRPTSGQSPNDVIDLLYHMKEFGYTLFAQPDGTIHVHAPHRKLHSWFDRGWTCEIGLTVAGCDKFVRLSPKEPEAGIETIKAREDRIKEEKLLKPGECDGGGVGTEMCSFRGPGHRCYKPDYPETLHEAYNFCPHKVVR